ncbi:MAG: Trk family potassium uptake protein [Firmicutes bacterium]|nr:Trk family potassium uptake protein [Bacillota bacterium]
MPKNARKTPEKTSHLKLSLLRFNSTEILILGYACIALLGAILLSLPVSAKDGAPTAFIDALFTSVSATCVTGLSVFDTFSHWSTFGQIIILIMIQVGGIGFMTLAISAISLTKKRIGLKQRFTMQDSVAGPQVGGIVKMTKFIFRGALMFELIGAALLSIRFIPVFGLGRGIYFSVFHSVSAFCNAGFDLMGAISPGSSLMSFAYDPLVMITIMALIVIGGLGFFVWADIKEHGRKFGRMKLQTKLVLFTTAILLIGSIILIYLFERDGFLAGHNATERALLTAFQAVTTRTAGFNTVVLAELRPATIALMLGLMLIGGSPGSTAGGMKTTTVAVLALCIPCEFKKKKSIEVFGRRLDDMTIRRAGALIAMYICFMLFAAMAICAIDGISLSEAFFETASAIGTVGMSMGVTSSLSIVSQIILIGLMFFGRLGGLTILIAVSDAYDVIPSQKPLEKIAVG